MLNEKKILVEYIAAAAASEVCETTCLNQFTPKILKKTQN